MLTRRNLKSGVVLGYLGSRSVAVSWLGTGVRDEARFENMLSDLGIELVINSGFAGAVRTLLEPGDFVLAENFSSTELVKRLEKHRAFEASPGGLPRRGDVGRLDRAHAPGTSRSGTVAPRQSSRRPRGSTRLRSLARKSGPPSSSKCFLVIEHLRLVADHSQQAASV